MAVTSGLLRGQGHDISYEDLRCPSTAGKGMGSLIGQAAHTARLFDN